MKLKADFDEADIICLVSALQTREGSLERYVRSNSNNPSLCQAYTSELNRAVGVRMKLQAGAV